MSSEAGYSGGVERGPSQGPSLTIAVSIPVQDADLYALRGTDDVLYYLANRPHDEFTITHLSDVLDVPLETTRRAVDVLAKNDLVHTHQSGNARPVQINRERLTRPDEPIVQIPQTEFHDPVRAAVDELRDRLENVVAIVLYGSVARGEADRKSDIDLWVLVDDDRAREQREAVEVKRELDEQRFGGDRYDFQIGVESTASVPSYTREIQDVVSSGFAVYRADAYDEIEQYLANLARDE